MNSLIDKETCPSCGRIQFDRFMIGSVYHAEWCPYHYDFSKHSYGHCVQCKEEITDCNLVYWIKDCKLCRKCNDGE